MSGSTQVIGDRAYTNLQIGDRSLQGSTQQIGEFRYGSWSDGVTSTTKSLGSYDYSTSYDYDTTYDYDCCDR